MAEIPRERIARADDLFATAHLHLVAGRHADALACIEGGRRILLASLAPEPAVYRREASAAEMDAEHVALSTEPPGKKEPPHE